ncbi:integrase [Bacillus cereus group sp. N28]|uniref:Integrase n=1 Tax=Bacillus pseudomycoides TaxID=64104 RepID=A0AAJ2DKG5_9BACI|nr:integrase [Bacillus cereus group sp. N28]MDR4326770.1 integrase [Bacillus pseudomycoides]
MKDMKSQITLKYIAINKEKKDNILDTFSI